MPNELLGQNLTIQDQEPENPLEVFVIGGPSHTTW